MSEQILTDLYQANSWHGFRPGMKRAEVLERVEALGETAEWDGENLMRILVKDNEVGFYFDDASRLRQISTDNEELTWNGKPFMGVQIDQALRALNPPGTALWQIGQGIRQFSKEPQTPPGIPLSDEQLIEGGTLWLPEHGLALHISEGQLFEVAWRAPHDLPSQFLGPLTEAQRQLSARPGLEKYLRAKRMERNHAQRLKESPRYLRTLRTLLTLTVIAILAFIGWISFQEMKVWAAAPVLNGKLLAIETGPSKQFLEYLPSAVAQWIPARIRSGGLWDTAPQTDIYRVQFSDPAGEEHEANLERAEFYVSPREIGEEVQVTYAAGPPARVKGPARARDAAFIDHAPWVIALGATYLVAQMLLGFLPALVRLLTRSIAAIKRPTPSDPDRPELH
ncbi:MAG: hypothetical protein JWL59_859 [Chthoniobacteraceae bacterium]|nr:hypothetical protein [Chthoniobacteraceae bacterium]